MITSNTRRAQLVQADGGRVVWEGFVVRKGLVFIGSPWLTYNVHDTNDPVTSYIISENLQACKHDNIKLVDVALNTYTSGSPWFTNM